LTYGNNEVSVEKLGSNQRGCYEYPKYPISDWWV